MTVLNGEFKKDTVPFHELFSCQYCNRMYISDYQQLLRDVFAKIDLDDRFETMNAYGDYKGRSANVTNDNVLRSRISIAAFIFAFTDKGNCRM